MMLMNSLVQLVVVFLLKVESCFSTISNNQSCYTCVEPLVGYTDFPDSCRFFNTSSPLATSYIKQCNENDDDDETPDGTTEYECRKLIISYRSVDTYLRRDCVPKGLCSWKDKSQSMINTPVSDCVYTDDHAQKLECIYCCDTPLCNRIRSISSFQSTFLRWFCIFFLFSRSHLFLTIKNDWHVVLSI